jgi:hypothetical protein
MSTYFHMRVRERGYSATTSVLDEADVLKAVGSVRRMSVGIQLEDRVRRKWSIRDEIASFTCTSTPTLDDGFPPLPPGLDMPVSPTYTPPTSTRISLPPISALLAPAMPNHDALVEAARAATNETNRRRRELEGKEEEVAIARGRYEEAKGSAERLREEVRRIEGGQGNWGFEE